MLCTSFSLLLKYFMSKSDMIGRPFPPTEVTVLILLHTNLNDVSLAHMNPFLCPESFSAGRKPPCEYIPVKYRKIFNAFAWYKDVYNVWNHCSSDKPNKGYIVSNIVTEHVMLLYVDAMSSWCSMADCEWKVLSLYKLLAQHYRTFSPIKSKLQY